MNDAQPAAQRLYIRRQENTKCIMYRYAAFLRAVNVGRGRTVKMDELRKMAEDLGFVDVRTFIQSGNLISPIWPQCRMPFSNLARGILAITHVAASVR